MTTRYAIFQITNIASYVFLGLTLSFALFEIGILVFLFGASEAIVTEAREFILGTSILTIATGFIFATLAITANALYPKVYYRYTCEVCDKSITSPHPLKWCPNGCLSKLS